MENGTLEANNEITPDRIPNGCFDAQREQVTANHLETWATEQRQSFGDEQPFSLGSNSNPKIE